MLGGCPTGDAKITKGIGSKRATSSTPSGLFYRGSPRDAELLAKLLSAQLSLAALNHLHSVAFPPSALARMGTP